MYIQHKVSLCSFCWLLLAQLAFVERAYIIIYYYVSVTLSAHLDAKIVRL